MKYRILGKTGYKVSTISMGCWALGGQWGDISESDAIRTINQAYDGGVNLFDTADSYGFGQSEFYTGKAIKDKRTKVFLATKVGNWGRRVGDSLSFKTIYSIINCCHASLYRLNTDYIDIYQCHIGKPENPDVFIEAFEILKEQGKIRNYAISTNDLNSLKAMNKNGNCSSCQINYSVLNRNAEKDILPFCLENNIGVLLRGPLAQGILTDKFNKNSKFNDSVRKKWNKGSIENKNFLSNLKKIDFLRKLVKKDKTMAEVALQFVLSHPAVTCAIPGMKSPKQSRQNSFASDGELDSSTINQIKKITPIN